MRVSDCKRIQTRVFIRPAFRVLAMPTGNDSLVALAVFVYNRGDLTKANRPLWVLSLMHFVH